MYDPDGLLGDKKDLGITCALVPRETPGADFGRRHFPLNAMFMNGPSRGKNVFMPIDFIIGGPKMAGKGWRMLMECLAAGRSISLPSCHAGMAQLTARTVGGYARVRSQFKMSIGRFEGIEEALTRHVLSDKIGHQVAKLMISPSASRDRLTAETYLPTVESESVGAIELALRATIDAEPIDARIHAAEKEGVFNNLPDANVRDIAQVAFAKGIVTAEEYALLKRRNHLRDIVIHVDDFPFDLGRFSIQPEAHKAAAC